MEHFDSNVESLSQSNRLLFQKYEAAFDKHNQELNRVFFKFEELKQSIERLKEEINIVDFPVKLDMISGSISQLENGLVSQSQLLQEGINNQASTFTSLAIIGGVIIVLQVVSMII